MKHAFTTVAEERTGGGLTIPVPFDPNDVWGRKERHHITGTVGGKRVRGELVRAGGRVVLWLGPAWCREDAAAPGQTVDVVLEPEGPTPETIGPDFAGALDEDSRRFFDSMPTHYRKNYARWISEAKRPDTRAKRIDQASADLKDGKRR